MRRLNVSVAGMMGLVLFLALSIAALRYASGLFGGAMCLLSMGLLMLAVAGVVYRREGRRAFCLGFALFGWGYVGMAYQSWGREFEGDDHWSLVTTEMLDRIRPSIESNNDDSLDWLGFASAKTRRVWAELDKPVSMPFGNAIPLEEVLKYIRTATTGPGLEQGIPIYVDPVGLSESEATQASPVTLNLDGVPLKKTLKLMLDQLDLTYSVRDGLMTISSKDSKQSRASQQTSPNFRRVGHCLIALFVGCIGGLATLRLYATRDGRRTRAEPNVNIEPSQT